MLAWTIRQGKEIKDIQIGKEEFADDIGIQKILRKPLKNSKLIKEFSKKEKEKKKIGTKNLLCSY